MGVLFLKVISIKMNIIFILIIANLLFSLSMSFAYWASSVYGTEQENQSSISLGSWYDGIPIYTAQEFIEAVTTNNNTNTYVLAKNIDFQNMSYPEWINNDAIVFKGHFDGNGKIISNFSATNLRALFGVIDGATIRNLNIENIEFNYAPGDAVTSGLLVGRIQGTNNLIDNIRIRSSKVINTSYPAGTIAGVIQPAEGVTTQVGVTIQNIKIIDTEIVGGYAETTYGTGGLVGTITTANVIMNDLYVEASVKSTVLTNIGGLVGATRTNSSLTINRAVVFASLENTSTSTVTTFGVASMIGRNSGTATVTHVFSTGFMRSRVINPTRTTWTTQAGILRGTTTGNNVTTTNSRSSQITLYRNTSNQAVLVNNATSYNKMTGQKSTHSSTNYVNLRSSLTSSWWNTYYGAITSQTSLWEYNPTTHLYQLKG